MLQERGIRRGIEVFVTRTDGIHDSEQKALVVNTYPHPSRWLVVKYENGDMEQVEESRVTTMYEKKREKLY